MPYKTPFLKYRHTIVVILKSEQYLQITRGIRLKSLYQHWCPKDWTEPVFQGRSNDYDDNNNRL